MDRFNRENSAYSFDGIDDFIQTNFNFYIQPMSISVWFLSNVNCGERPIVDSDSFGRWGQSIIQGYWSGNDRLFVQYHTGEYESPISIIPFKWYHAVVLFENSKVRLFVNNKFVGEEKYNQRQMEGSTFTRFGTHNEYAPQRFEGKIDDIRIYNRILNEDEKTDYIMRNRVLNSYLLPHFSY